MPIRVYRSFYDTCRAIYIVMQAMMTDAPRALPWNESELVVGLVVQVR